MAYQAKRNQVLTENLELIDENGTCVKTIHVELNPDSMARKLSEKHIALIHIQQELKKMELAGTEDIAGGLSALQDGIRDLLESVFGEEDTREIITFYHDRYIEICLEIIPFITNVIIPRCRKMAQENKKKIVSSYGRPKVFGRK